METLRLSEDESFCLWRRKPFLRETLNMRERLVCMWLFLWLCVRLYLCSGQVTMERAELPNVSYFKPQQSVVSTRTQPRINKRGRGDARPEKTARNGWKRDREHFKGSFKNTLVYSISLQNMSFFRKLCVLTGGFQCRQLTKEDLTVPMFP